MDKAEYLALAQFLREAQTALAAARIHAQVIPDTEARRDALETIDDAGAALSAMRRRLAIL